MSTLHKNSRQAVTLAAMQIFVQAASETGGAVSGGVVGAAVSGGACVSGCVSAAPVSGSVSEGCVGCPVPEEPEPAEPEPEDPEPAEPDPEDAGFIARKSRAVTLPSSNIILVFPSYSAICRSLAQAGKSAIQYQ